MWVSILFFFLPKIQRDEFDNDPGWDTLDEEDPFTDEEFRAYEMQRQREIIDYTPRPDHKQEDAVQPNLQVTYVPVIRSFNYTAWPDDPKQEEIFSR